MKAFFLVLLTLAIAPLAYAQGTYRIQPGDTLDITVLEDANLNRQVLVRPDGGISVPIAGNIQAGGNSIQAVERIITERLAPGFSIQPTVSVALTGVAAPVGTVSSTVDVFFIGEIGSQGQTAVPRGSTILQALAAAGGPGPFAAKKRIQLRRTDRSGHETVFLFNYADVMNGARIQNNLVVEDGDIILVPERKLFE